jgi:multimeric flavodoxin WrbA
MKIVVLQGSPNRAGSTSMLVEEFTRGAESSGHRVTHFDVVSMNINACIGCVSCGYEGPCVQKDDNQKIREAVLSADMIVFATPLYYYGMTAQLKTVVDRFCAYNSSIHRKHMKSALLAVAWNSDDWTFDALESHYQTIVKYLNLEDCGMVLGRGCGSLSMTRHSDYMEMAYVLGRSLS